MEELSVQLDEQNYIIGSNSDASSNIFVEPKKGKDSRSSEIYSLATKGKMVKDATGEELKDALSKFPKLAENFSKDSISSIFSDMTSVDDDNTKVFSIKEGLTETDLSNLSRKVKDTKDLLSSNIKLDGKTKTLLENQIKDIEDTWINRRTEKQEVEFDKYIEDDDGSFEDNIEGLMKSFYESEHTGTGETFSDYLTGRDATDTFKKEVLPYLNMIMVAEGKGKLDMADFYSVLKNDVYYKQKDWDANVLFGLEEGKEVRKHPFIDALKQVPALRSSFSPEGSFIAKATDFYVDTVTEQVGKRAKAIGEITGDSLKFLVDKIRNSSANLSFKDRQNLLRDELKKINSRK